MIYFERNLYMHVSQEAKLALQYSSHGRGRGPIIRYPRDGCGLAQQCRTRTPTARKEGCVRQVTSLIIPISYMYGFIVTWGPPLDNEDWPAFAEEWRAGFMKETFASVVHRAFISFHRQFTGNGLPRVARATPTPIKRIERSD